MKPGMMKHGWILGGLLIAGCQTGADPGASSNAAAPLETGAMHTMDDALSAGRLAALPQGLVMQKAEVFKTALADHEAAKKSEKPDGVARVAVFDPEEEGETQVDLQNELKPSEGLRLTLSLPKEDYVIGEPVIVRATIENVSDHNLRLPPLLDPQFQYNHFVMTSPSGKTLGFSPIAIACSRGEMQVQTMAPGEKHVEDVPIFFHKDGWLFGEVGTYRIQSLFRGITEDSTRVDSNTVSLTVHAGTPADQEAAKLIMGHDQGLFVMWGQGDHLEEGIDALNTIATRYPETTLAAYARYALGSNMSTDFLDGRYARVRKADPQAVLSDLLPLEARLKGDDAPVLSPDMIKGTFEKVADAYAQLGQRDAARQTLRDMLRTQTDNPVLSDDDLNEVEGRLSKL